MKLAALRGNSWVKTHLHCAEPAPAPSTESLVRMLLARRIDAVIEDKLVLLDLARQLGVSTQLRTQPLEAGAAPMYLLIGKRSPLQAHVPRIEEALHAMQRDGSLQALAAPRD